MGVSSQFHLLQETLFLSVNVLDRYLQTSVVPKKLLPLVAIGCLWVATRNKENLYLSHSSFMTGNIYSNLEIFKMGTTILKQAIRVKQVIRVQKLVGLPPPHSNYLAS